MFFFFIEKYLLRQGCETHAKTPGGVRNYRSSERTRNHARGHPRPHWTANFKGRKWKCGSLTKKDRYYAKKATYSEAREPPLPPTLPPLLPLPVRVPPLPLLVPPLPPPPPPLTLPPPSKGSRLTTGQGAGQ